MLIDTKRVNAARPALLLPSIKKGETKPCSGEGEGEGRQFTVGLERNSEQACLETSQTNMNDDGVAINRFRGADRCFAHDRVLTCRLHRQSKTVNYIYTGKVSGVLLLILLSFSHPSSSLSNRAYCRYAVHLILYKQEAFKFSVPVS